jgi:iron complex transport system ATP-binding protein
MKQPILDIREVGYKINDKMILDRVSWQVANGEHWVILGPNGAGKTTLLKIACGYIWPNSGGKIYRNGRDLIDLRELRKNIGWVTVSLLNQIPPDETVIRTVVSGKYAQLGLREYAGQKLNSSDDTRARQYLSEMDCADLANQKFGTLSQGEKQRVLISRARMAAPLLLILDEPCAGLDPGGRETLLTSIRNLAEIQQEMGLIFVTQRIEEIIPIFEKILVLARGKVVENDLTEKVISSELIQRLYGVSAKVLREGQRYWMVCD